LALKIAEVRIAITLAILAQMGQVKSLSTFTQIINVDELIT